MSAKYRREIGVGLVAITLAALGWFVVIPFGIDLPSQIDIEALAPDFWPRIVMVLLAVSGIFIAVQGYFDGRNPPLSDDAADDEGAVEHELPMLTLRVAFALAAMFVFYLTILEVGIVIASALIIIAFSYVLGQRQWKLILSLAVALPVLLYVFFVHVASVPMPLGMLETFR